MCPVDRYLVNQHRRQKQPAKNCQTNLLPAHGGSARLAAVCRNPSIAIVAAALVVTDVAAPPREDGIEENVNSNARQHDDKSLAFDLRWPHIDDGRRALLRAAGNVHSVWKTLMTHLTYRRRGGRWSARRVTKC